MLLCREPVTTGHYMLAAPNALEVHYEQRVERARRHVRRNVTDNFYFGTLPRLMTAVTAFLTELASSPSVILSIIA